MTKEKRQVRPPTERLDNRLDRILTVGHSAEKVIQNWALALPAEDASRKYLEGIFDRLQLGRSQIAEASKDLKSLLGGGFKPPTAPANGENNLTAGLPVAIKDEFLQLYQTCYPRYDLEDLYIHSTNGRKVIVRSGPEKDMRSLGFVPRKHLARRLATTQPLS